MGPYSWAAFAGTGIYYVACDPIVTLGNCEFSSGGRRVSPAPLCRLLPIVGLMSEPFHTTAIFVAVTISIYYNPGPQKVLLHSQR